jgi:DNA-binding transcriptional ArsR family regulator
MLCVLYKHTVVEEIIVNLPHPLPEDLAELIARRFRALAEPARVRLLDRLRDGEASVNELAAQLGMTQQNVSKHLAVLADIGIVGRRKTGNHVYYRIVDEGVLGLCEQVCGSVQAQLAALTALVEHGRPLSSGAATPRAGRTPSRAT